MTVMEASKKHVDRFKGQVDAMREKLAKKESKISARSQIIKTEQE
jgi:hypothetical protein